MTIQQAIRLTMYDVLAKNFLFSLGCILLNLPNRNTPILYVDGEERDYVQYYHLEKEYEAYQMNKDMIDTFSLDNGVKTSIIYSSTDEKITPININIKNGISTLEYGEGDGLITLESMLYPRKWSQPKLEFIHIANEQHTDILSSDELINLINNV